MSRNCCLSFLQAKSFPFEMAAKSMTVTPMPFGGAKSSVRVKEVLRQFVLVSLLSKRQLAQIMHKVKQAELVGALFAHSFINEALELLDHLTKDLEKDAGSLAFTRRAIEPPCMLN